MNFPSSFRHFAANHPYLARFGALPVAVGQGFKASLKMPYYGLDIIIKNVAHVGIKPHDPRISKFFSVSISGIGIGLGITMLAVSPLVSPIMGAAKATSVFFKLLRNPTAFY
jgi:hypothetical protein